MRNDKSDYRVEQIFKKRKVTLRDILTLDACGIFYENVGANYLIVHYNDEEIWMKF